MMPLISSMVRVVAYSAARQTAQTLRETGEFSGLDASFGYDALQRLFPKH